MQEYKRSTRVGTLIQHTVAELVRDIRELNVGLVTIMGVKLTDDLLNCKIIYSVLGGEEEKLQAQLILRKNIKQIRHQLAQKLNLRRTPELLFVYDDTSEQASKIFDILKKIEDEKK